jgi:hypothetical protein
MPAGYVFDYPVVADEGRTQLIGIALPKLSTPLYIGKEESHRAGWQVGFVYSSSHDHLLIKNQTLAHKRVPTGQRGAWHHYSMVYGGDMHLATMTFFPRARMKVPTRTFEGVSVTVSVMVAPSVLPE